MDLSIVATVGSFAFSERVLKPKATVLVILGIVLVYDLATKTQDVSSLRVYRGPILLVFTIMMVAYSLRKWRRNGVACDEFIFLPGTRHGHHVGIEAPLIEALSGDADDSDEDYTYSEREIESQMEMNMNMNRAFENTNCSGMSPQPQHKSVGKSLFSKSSRSSPMRNATPEAKAMPDSPAEKGGDKVSKGRVLEMVSIASSQQSPIRANSNSSGGENVVREDCKDDDENDHDKLSLIQKIESLEAVGERQESKEDDDNDDDNDNEDFNEAENDGLIAAAATTTTNETTATNDSDQLPEPPSSGTTHSPASAGGIRGRLRRCVERHPHLAKLWTFFFNRSAAASNANATYAPSGPAVFGAALDLSMPVLFNFHVFIMTFNHILKPNYTGSELPVNVLPIGFLAVLYARMVIPPSRRARFWGTMKFSFSAPMHRVGVRDEFIGDCLTSWVRPGQDLIFATIYFFVIIWGTISGRYGLTKTGEMLAESWFVHNVLLPFAGMVPLWFKYLQTLRQAYDDDRRWPHLGNAAKYLSAALVVVYGTTHPEQRRSLTWIACFVAATIFQVIWDVVVDWQLFEIQRDISVVIAGAATSGESSTISSFRPDSRILLAVHMYLLQPIRDRYQMLRARIPGWGSIQLRQRRLYKTESFYWHVFVFNAVTRFAWMYCFLPAYHFSQTSNESASATIVLTSSSEVQSFWGVLLPACEIFRRTLWGFLYMERQTIRMMDTDAKYQRVGADAYGDDGYDDEFDLESEERTINSKLDETRNSFRSKLLPTWLGNQQQMAHSAATARAKEQKKLFRKLFVAELCVWSVAFVVLCGVVAVI